MIVPVIIKSESISIKSWYKSNKKRLLDAITLCPDIFIQPDFTFFVVDGTVILVVTVAVV